jgi:hypothetical protein
MNVIRPPADTGWRWDSRSNRAIPGPSEQFTRGRGAGARRRWRERAHGCLKLAFGVDQKVRGRHDALSGLAVPFVHDKVVAGTRVRLSISRRLKVPVAMPVGVNPRMRSGAYQTDIHRTRELPTGVRALGRASH